jgi:hypothetical protein
VANIGQERIGMKLADRFFSDAPNISNMADPATHISYKEFLAYFSGLQTLTEHDVVIGAYFTYGWMPTILDLRGDLTEVVKIANCVKQSKKIADEDLRKVACAINGSVVGASKFLHFISPKDHAIWDSRVYRYLHEKEPYQYRLEAPDVYWDYLIYLDSLAQDNRFSQAKQAVEEVVGYTVTDKRAAELVMFFNGKK